MSEQLLRRTRAMLNKYRLLLLEESRVRHAGSPQIPGFPTGFPMGLPTGFPPDLEFPFKIPLGISLDQDSLRVSPKSQDFPTGSPPDPGITSRISPWDYPGIPADPGIPPRVSPPGFPLGFPQIQDFSWNPHRIIPDPGIPYRFIPGFSQNSPLESPLKFLLGFPQDSPFESPWEFPPHSVIPPEIPTGFPPGFSMGLSQDSFWDSHRNFPLPRFPQTPKFPWDSPWDSPRIFPPGFPQTPGIPGVFPLGIPGVCDTDQGGPGCPRSAAAPRPRW